LSKGLSLTPAVERRPVAFQKNQTPFHGVGWSESFGLTRRINGQTDKPLAKVAQNAFFVIPAKAGIQ
jgi:hypothetical protein